MISQSKFVQFHYIECNIECKIMPKLLISVVIKETLLILIFLHSAPLPSSVMQHLLPSGFQKNLFEVVNVLAFCESLASPDAGGN